MEREPNQPADNPDEETDEIRGMVDVLTKKVKPIADDSRREGHTVRDDLADK